MATIKMTSGFTICPEGEHIFRIWRVDYDQDFGKVVVYLVNAQGNTHIERFNLMLDENTPNPKACSAFSFFAKAALNDTKREEIEHTELLNKFIGLEITHTTTASGTYANSVKRWSADGFDTEPCKKALELGNAPAPVEQPTEGVNLDNLLN